MSSVRPRSSKNNNNASNFNQTENSGTTTISTKKSYNNHAKTNAPSSTNSYSSSSTKLRAPLAPIQNHSKQNGNQNKLPYNAPRTRSQSRGKINVLKKVHQNNRNNSQLQNQNQSYASKVSSNNNERPHQTSNFQNSVPQYVQKPRTIARHDSGVYIDSVPSSYENNNNSSLNLSNMQVDDSSLTTHFHDLHDVSVNSKEGTLEDFAMHDETSTEYKNKLKLCSTPITSKKQTKNNNLKFLDFKYYSNEEAYQADWNLSDDINEKHYKSYKNNGIEQYANFHDEYQNNYFNNMLKIEQKHAPDARYLLKQENYRQQSMLRQSNEMNYGNSNSHHRRQRRTAPTYQMRVKVVDWLLELQDHFRVVSPETFHLSVSYIDRYFSTREVDQEQMQEVAVTATFLASKFVDYQSPSLNELSEITAHSVSKEDILAREKDMLKTFRCNLCTPTVYHFLMEIICSKGLTGAEFRQIRRVAFYFCDISRLAYELLEFPSRVLAVACLFLSFSSSCDQSFTERIIYHDKTRSPMFYMQIEVNELDECIRMLMDIYKKCHPSKFEDNNNNDNNGSSTSVYGKHLYANKRWAITRSTFQKDYEKYDSRRDFENWRRTVEKDLKELIKTW